MAIMCTKLQFCGVLYILELEHNFRYLLVEE